MALPVDRITALLNEVAASEILPRFGRLLPSEVIHKATAGEVDDVVSAVDHAVEARLARGLSSLVPTATVLGEEAVHANPALLDDAGRLEEVFWVDPIDGTRAFVRGSPDFGVMVAYVRRGVTEAAWIALPAHGAMFVAQRGAGVLRNGARLPPLATSGPSEPFRGSVYEGFLPPDLKARAAALPARLYERVPPNGCAAIEYTGLACDEKDFVTYHRLLPWDHAAGALVLEEAGGATLRRNGGPYAPEARNELLVAATSRATAETVQRWLTTDA